MLKNFSENYGKNLKLFSILSSGKIIYQKFQNKEFDKLYHNDWVRDNDGFIWSVNKGKWLIKS